MIGIKVTGIRVKVFYDNDPESTSEREKKIQYRDENGRWHDAEEVGWFENDQDKL